MKLKLIIKNKKGDELQTAIFDDQKSIDAFKDVLSKGESWGKPERWLAEKDFKGEDKAKAVDSRIVSRPGQEDLTEYKFESEYFLEQSDVTAEFDAEKAKKDKKKTDRALRVDQLKSFDWTKIKKLDDALPLLKLLVDELIKDD